jgi:hypothetical protein
MTESWEILNNYDGKFGNSNRLSLARTLKTVPEMRDGDICSFVT